jgi:hypothetical protein
MAESRFEARRILSGRVRAASLFAICLIVLTALLELGLGAAPPL